MARLSLTREEREHVSRAIAKAEERTSGELVVVVTAQSDDYLEWPIYLAITVALAIPALGPWLARLTPWQAISFGHLYIVQLACFLLVAGLFSVPRLRYFLTPRARMKKAAARNAAMQFLARNMHSTRGRTGVLIFVSLLERYCEIVGDQAIAAKATQADWQGIIDEMLGQFQQDRLAHGLAVGVERAGDLLCRNFPPGTANPNELPNHLIVLE